MYERKNQDLIKPHEFLIRMVKVIFVTALAVSVIILGGGYGFSMSEEVSLVEGVHHAVWVAMGHPGDHVPHNHLLFEAGYVLVARLTLFTSAAFVVTPIFHRIMHKLHLDRE